MLNAVYPEGSFVRNSLRYRDANWLQSQRSSRVAGLVRTLMAGNTGTRLNIGKPQIRWEQGVELARELDKQRKMSIRGSNVLSLHTRWQNAMSGIRDLWNM